ncbi:MAG: protein phosphatase 2C domain-containing protein [Pseudomonadota bacterium]
MIPYAAKTHQGLKRNKNEDNYAAEPSIGLWVVADGVGGHSNGEVASRIACEALVAGVRDGLTLAQSIGQAHESVLEEIRARGQSSDQNSTNMGTTIVAVVFSGRKYTISWVGDSRAYLFDGNLKQLTRDHSAISELLARGVLSPDKVADHPQRHALSRSLGVSDLNTSTPSSVSGKLRKGQQLLLCSDGLTDELSDDQIQRKLRSKKSADDQVEALIQSALAHGGSDNLTVILIGDPPEKRSSIGDQLDLDVTQDIRDPIPTAVSRSGHPFLKLWLPLLVIVLVAITLLS